MMKTTPPSYMNGRVRLYVGDLTDQAVDAIVNAANRTLLGGGGVDGAIHRRGGPAILDACRELRRSQWPDGLPTGQVALTNGGKLPAPYVIHTVGPIYGQHRGKEAELLAACYRNAIELAAHLELKSLAFPSISTGAFGYPPDKAALIVSRSMHKVLDEIAAIDEIRLVFFNASQMETFIAHQNFPR
uniref:Appr-1-p processing n=1 Tax=Dechloromonas aromatica (strain RCB) TaxID=159087 RepID=Q47EQ7_DECAR